jgi:DNA-binding response OmpR family regulator
MKSLPPDEDAIAVLLTSNDVTTECAKLWESLGEDEREGIRVVVRGAKPVPGTDVLRRLRLKGLITDADALFSILFARYVAELHVPQRVETKVQAGPIRIDTAGEAWVEGKRLDPPLTVSELQLLTYFCSKAGQLCSKDEIGVALHPEDYEHGEVMSDAALTALVERLRKRIENNPGRPKFILTIRGKGYMLRV